MILSLKIDPWHPFPTNDNMDMDVYHESQLIDDPTGNEVYVAESPKRKD